MDYGTIKKHGHKIKLPANSNAISQALLQTVQLPKQHPCHGCPMYSRKTNVLFCMMPRCIRNQLEG